MRKVCAVIALMAGVAVSAPVFAQGSPSMGDKETPLQKQEKLKEEERKAIERDVRQDDEAFEKPGGRGHLERPLGDCPPGG